MSKIIWYVINVVVLAAICGGVAFLAIYYSDSSTECKRRYFKASEIDASALDGFVCVCTAGSCEQAKPVGDLVQGATIVFYKSSRAEDRLKQSVIEFQTGGTDWGDPNVPSVTVSVDSSQQFQKILGFGGAFTDAAGINIRTLSEATQQTLLESYFGDTGLNYTLGRVPIASTDFSATVYSYLDKEGDFNLTTFALAPEDFNYKIPFIQKASKLSQGRLKLFASPWSGPGWMKTNGLMKGGASLKGEWDGPYFVTYAKYFVRFFEEYFKQGIRFWGMTIQNEPSNGLKPQMRYQSMNFTPAMEKFFAKNVLKPIMGQSTAAKDVKIMVHDDNRDMVLQWGKDIYVDDDKNESTAIDGMAIHWYEEGYYDDLTKVHEMKPDKFILSTEACAGWKQNEHVPLLGDWKRGEMYGHDILNDLKNWAIGWTDWNLVLDLQGGPNWVLNDVDAAILVNKNADEFFKQPMYYFLGHFSKFIPRDSARVASEMKDFDLAGKSGSPNSVEHVAFRTPDEKIVLVVMNTDTDNSYRLSLMNSGFEDKTGRVILPPNSIITAIWSEIRR